jgi:hypothetical protein
MLQRSSLGIKHALAFIALDELPQDARHVGRWTLAIQNDFMHGAADATRKHARAHYSLGGRRLNPSAGG